MVIASKGYDVQIQYHLVKAYVVVSTLNPKMHHSMTNVVMVRSKILRDLKIMSI